MLFKRTAAALLLLPVLFCAAARAETNPPPQPEAPADGAFYPVAQNSRFQMYLEDRELNICVENRETGEKWYTSPAEPDQIEGLSGAGKLLAGSHLIVNYLDKKTQVVTAANSLLNSVRRGAAKMRPVQNGVRIDFHFSKESEDFTVPAEFILTEDGLDARILFTEIRENKNLYITRISLLPYFGAATQREEGFILVPDGSGAVIRLGSGREGMKPYAQAVYGADKAITVSQKTTNTYAAAMPVFGMSKQNGGFFAVIKSGASLATLNAFPSGISGVLNAAYAQFDYRQTDYVTLADATWAQKQVVTAAKKAYEKKDVGVSYYLLPAGKSDLAAMAALYRKELERTCRLTRRTDTSPAMVADFYGAARQKKSFLGIGYEVTVPLTTFGQAASMVRDLQEGGVDALTVRYLGTLRGGLDSSAVTKAVFEKKLGGDKEFRRFIKESGVPVFPDLEFVKITKSKFGWQPFQIAARNISLTAITENQFRLSTNRRRTDLDPVYIISPAKLEKEIASLRKNGAIPGAEGISAGSLGHILTSDYSLTKTYFREDAVEKAEAALAGLKKAYGKVMTDNANQYSAVLSDAITGVPVTDSAFDVCYAGVPFYQMVFGPYAALSAEPLNLSSDYYLRLLRCIETGTNPAFAFSFANTEKLAGTPNETLGSTLYAAWSEIAKDCYREYSRAAGEIGSSVVVDYRIVSPDLRVTTYEGGARAAVNYGYEDARYDSVVIPPRSYHIFKEGDRP